jgi:hypothetical protein
MLIRLAPGLGVRVVPGPNPEEIENVSASAYGCGFGFWVWPTNPCGVEPVLIGELGIEDGFELGADWLEARTALVEGGNVWSESGVDISA